MRMKCLAPMTGYDPKGSYEPPHNSSARCATPAFKSLEPNPATPPCNLKPSRSASFVSSFLKPISISWGEPSFSAESHNGHRVFLPKYGIEILQPGQCWRRRPYVDYGC